nr:sensor histidine kinase [Maritimibacter sp. UBA3975]|tara:strand:+ start:18738 stop:19388 length:651 start_codon:yes stop_codon:yes gene_type:complete
MERHSEFESLQVAEIRHRMTNGFQLLQAYTRQQLRRCESDEAREQVRRVLDQIRSVSSLQTALTEADLGKFGDFLDQIETHWTQLGRAQGIEVGITADTPRHLPAKTAENAARVLMEAVTNCLEHAFPDGAGGRIDVSVELVDGHRLCLRIADDGVGLTDAPGDGQGTGIIAALAAEMGGEAVWTPRDGGGALLSVTFPVAPENDMIRVNGTHANG